MFKIIILVLVVYFTYFFVSIKRFDKEGHYKNKKKKKIEDFEALPSEVKFFIQRYKVDLTKVNLRAVLKLIGTVLAFEIVTIMIIVNFFVKEVALQIIIATITLFPIYLISLSYIGKYFKKKGWVKNV